MFRQGFLAAALTLAGLPAIAQPAGEAQVIGLPKAVSIAEAAGRGRVLEAEMDYEKGRLVYEVRTTGDKGVKELLIDAMSGAVVAERPLRVESVLHSLRNADQLSAVSASHTALPQLLTQIESDRKSRVTEVSIERERGQTFYEVDVADGGRKVMIDPRTGVMRAGRYDD